MERREFLRAGAGLAAGLLAGGPMAAAAHFGRLVTAPSRPPFPYVDGLTFLSPDPADVTASGLSAFLCDVSAAEAVPTADGSPRWTRSFEACDRSIRAQRQRLAEGGVPGAFLATRGSEIPGAHAADRTAIYFQFQGADPIGTELDRLAHFHALGLRVLQITHHHDNAWGGGALERVWSGLTAVGREGIERMEALGMVPDLSHVGDPTALDVLRASRRPVIVSHGAARALVPNARCTPDEVIRGVADSGGVMGIFMMSFWLTADAEPTVDAFVRQVRHVVDVGGIDAVGVANDYTVAGELNAASVGNDNATAVTGYLPWWDSMARAGVMGFEARPRHVVIPELNHVRRMYTIHEALERAGFRGAALEKIMGGNWIRVLTDALG